MVMPKNSHFLLVNMFTKVKLSKYCYVEKQVRVSLYSNRTFSMSVRLSHCTDVILVTPSLATHEWVALIDVRMLITGH